MSRKNSSAPVKKISPVAMHIRSTSSPERMPQWLLDGHHAKSKKSQNV